MNTSVIDQPLSPGIISIDMAGQVFTHKLRPPPLSPADNAIVLDLASPLYNPGATIDGVSKVYDRSGQGNHGTITGATYKTLPSGQVYLDFDGADDKLAIPHSASIALTNNFALEMWVYYTTFATNEILISKRATGVGNYGFQIYAFSADGHLNMASNVGNVNSDASLVVAGQWIHIFIIDDNTTLTYYKNGVAAGSGTLTTGADSGEPLVYGINYSDAPDLFTSYKVALPRAYNAVPPSTTPEIHFNQERHLFGR